MRIWTFGELYDKVLLDLDLTNENFVTFDEVVGYGNEAIQEAEAEILTLHEDYFLTNDILTLVAGTASYDLPTDIYANKFRDIVYLNGVIIYQIKRVRDPRRFALAQAANINASTTEYGYLITNASAAVGRKMVLYPTPYESGAFVTRWYIRNANRVPLSVSPGSLAASRATVVDIPEFSNFLMQFMKVRILAKEGGPMLQENMAVLEQQRKMMVDTLTQMVPDNDDQIIPDLSHYYEHE